MLDDKASNAQKDTAIKLNKIHTDIRFSRIFPLKVPCVLEKVFLANFNHKYLVTESKGLKESFEINKPCSESYFKIFVDNPQVLDRFLIN